MAGDGGLVTWDWKDLTFLPLLDNVLDMFQTQTIPSYASVAAGFPSPAEDHAEGRLDIQALLIRRPVATFFCRAQGESMREAGINDGDLLVVDRSITAGAGDVVVANLGDGLVVKRLVKSGDGWALASDNPNYPTFPVNPDIGVQVWGVVTFAVTALCPR